MRVFYICGGGENLTARFAALTNLPQGYFRFANSGNRRSEIGRLGLQIPPRETGWFPDPFPVRISPQNQQNKPPVGGRFVESFL